MSFIAVCDECNQRQSYDMPHAEALQQSKFDGWLIETDKKLCFKCQYKSEWDEIEGVDGSDVDRVTNELIERGGADAILGQFLRDKVAEFYATYDSVACVND